MEGLLFNVEKVPVKDLGISIPTEKQISHAIVGNGRILNFCSPDYHLVKNQQIVEDFSRFLTKEKINFDMSFMSYRDCRFKIMFYLKGFQVEMGKDDPVAPALYVWNSYNGSLKYQFGIQVMRQICTNGLTAIVDIKHLKMLHTLGAVGAIDKSLEMITEFRQAYQEIIEPFEDLKLFPVRDIDFRIDTVVENTDYPLWLGDLAKDRAQREMLRANVPATDWLVYNALNYGLNHQADHLLGRRADSIDAQVLEFLLNS